LACGRNDHTPVRPLEKLDPKEVFDLLDLRTQSRLADMTGLRGTPEMPAIRGIIYGDFFTGWERNLLIDLLRFLTK
jgi:hypothetical protein